MTGDRAILRARGGDVSYVPLDSAIRSDLLRIPVTTLILLEMQLRHFGHPAPDSPDHALSFLPARIICQDHSGVPALLDLAAMRQSLHRAGLDPQLVTPALPVDLVVDHSIEAFAAGSNAAYARNAAREYAQNKERYAFLRWADRAFMSLRVVPPGKGIVHQLHLEHLADVIATRQVDGQTLAFPDTVLGTDSHTPMINAIGVLGFGIGGIDATAVMLGYPMPLRRPDVLGVRLVGAPQPGVTITDIVLTITEALRGRGVIAQFLEFFGPGVAGLSVQDRATIANMSPEYGATCALFPIDRQVLEYLALTRADADQVDLVERYAKEQGLYRDGGTAPEYAATVTIDLSAVEPCAAGPRRPQDRLPLSQVPSSIPGSRVQTAAGQVLGGAGMADGSVAIAAITSCTNTANTAGMITAGLVARRAVMLGLKVPGWVKTSLAPGSRAVTGYLQATGLLADLEALGFHLVGYGCTTCIGNSGPLTDEAAAAADRGTVLAAVLSGNRNFEGRIHADVAAGYLASPALVVAWALAGSVRVDLTTDPLGRDPEGKPVTLADLWPDQAEIDGLLNRALSPELYRQERNTLFAGEAEWDSLAVLSGDLFPWNPVSTYLVEPPFSAADAGRAGLADIVGARVLAYLGDCVTTDHISPAGAIPPCTPAGRYLLGLDVAAADLGTYGGRRGNHEVLVRGTFGNPRLSNRLTPGRPGGWTRILPDGPEATIPDAAGLYASRQVPLLVLAGRDYGMGSSRDWAAKGPALLGVRAVLASGFERIHRGNLVGMGVLPIKLPQSPEELGLTGTEEYDLFGLADLRPGGPLTVEVRQPPAPPRLLVATAGIESAREVEYISHGGVLRLALDDLARRARGER